MSYKSIQQLPEGIKYNLPKKAQEIYISAFNDAIERHEDLDDNRQISHRVAWAAVREKYEKTNGVWTKQ